MRPDPQRHPQDDDSSRIIYLGDVRRRRQARRRQPDRHYLAVLAAIALAGWATWLVVVFNLTPERLLTYVAFFLPLGVAVAATCAIGLYALEWRAGRFPVLGINVRRGILVAALIVVNLGFQAAHRWSIPVGGLSVLGAIAAEATLERRSA